jgi:paraquat-inducible protein B
VRTAGVTHFKLGLLTLAVFAALVTTLVVLGLHRSGAPAVTYHTYFDESVQGLGTGSPVKFRGVRIGNVSSISIAPDGRYVEVAFALDVDATRRLRITDRPVGLRTQLSTQGLTGVKFIDMDVIPDAPPQLLPFTPAPRTIPAQPSLLKGVETAIHVVGERVPSLLEQMSRAIGKLDHLLDDIDGADIPARLAATIDLATEIATHARRVFASIDRARLPAALSDLVERAGQLVANVDAAATTAQATLDTLGGEHGLVARAHEAVTGIDTLSRRAIGSTEEFDRTMRDVAEAAQALRDLLDAIERDPDMLVKGRTRGRGP